LYIINARRITDNDPYKNLSIILKAHCQKDQPYTWTVWKGLINHYAWSCVTFGTGANGEDTNK
jgi:hypothetical protein